MKKIFFLLFVFLPVLLYAQEQAQIDSLLKALSMSKGDTNRVNIIIALSYTCKDVDPDNGIKYGKEGIQLAEKLSWKEKIAESNANVGSNYFSRSDYPEALSWWLKALEIYEASGNKKEIAAIFINIGNLYCIQTDFSKALEYFQKALTINEGLNDKAKISHNLGEIGNAYSAQNNFPKALEYYNKALDINKALEDKGGIALNVGNIGTVYFNEASYPKALEYYFSALKMQEALGDKSSIVIDLGNIGESYFLIAKDTTGAIKEDSLIPKGKTANLHKGIEYLDRAIKLAKEIEFLNAVQEYSNYLSQAQELSGNYKEALAGYKQFTAAKDSIFNTENNVKITGMETKRELELKDKQIEIDRLAVTKKRNERGFFIAGILAMLVIIVIIFRNYKLLSVEKQKSEVLLLNILPAEVAEELKKNGVANAKHFDNVTVFFTDFVNFTEAGERMSPQQLVGELHSCFKAFDDILGRYNIEKIKTVGDAYLAVSGLPAANPNHAEDVVAAAIEIRDFMLQRERQLGNGTFGIRIGVHSGSVVAGIVGIKKFAYDIWGDTVNIAARMEQNSEPGKINISETTFQLVKDKFTCVYRGEINAKNKGQLKMYFIS